MDGKWSDAATAQLLVLQNAILDAVVVETRDDEHLLEVKMVDGSSLAESLVAAGLAKQSVGEDKDTGGLL